MGSRLTPCLCACIAVLGQFVLPVAAGVLPDDRADMLYHYYDGGGVQIDGPSILFRKKVKQDFSLYGNYYVDSVSSASIDVITTGASPYSEERTEITAGIDYLHDDTLMSLSFTDSDESDYQAESLNLGIAQEVFGGMTTVTMGYGRGSDVVRRNLADGSTDPTFMETVDRRNYRLGISQVITRNMLLGLAYEGIADEGFLNNPYRSVRYLDSSSSGGFSFEPEIYPNTRSSNAIAISSRYFLPYRAALHGGYRFFSDSWGIDAHNFDIGYTHPWKQAWLFDLSYRYYAQTSADFYADLFPFAGSQNFLARDKELSTFNSHTIRLGVGYDFLEQGWRFMDKATVNFYYDHILFDYDDFRDISQVDANGNPLYPPGQEPFYSFSSDVIQLFFSIWF